MIGADGIKANAYFWFNNDTRIGSADDSGGDSHDANGSGGDSDDADGDKNADSGKNGDSGDDSV